MYHQSEAGNYDFGHRSFGFSNPYHAYLPGTRDPGGGHPPVVEIAKSLLHIKKKTRDIHYVATSSAWMMPCCVVRSINSRPHRRGKTLWQVGQGTASAGPIERPVELPCTVLRVVYCTRVHKKNRICLRVESHFLFPTRCCPAQLEKAPVFSSLEILGLGPGKWTRWDICKELES